MEIELLTARLIVGKRITLMSERHAKQLRQWTISGPRGSHRVICSCTLNSEMWLLVHGPNGVERIRRSDFVNCGVDRVMGVDLNTVEHIVFL